MPASDEREFITDVWFLAPALRREQQLTIPSDVDRVILHVVNAGKRIRRATLRIDDKPLRMKINSSTRTIDIPFRTHGTCHTISADVDGPDGAELWVLVQKP